MREAVEEAKSTSGDDKTPFASLIVKDNVVVVRAHNETRRNMDPTCHAEINAIRKACTILQTRDLSGCTLYTTVEPCPMCFAAAWWSNISRIVYGASIEDAAENELQFELSTKVLNERSGNRIELDGRILKEACVDLF